MQTVDEKIETLHIYVVRDESPKHQLYPIFFSVLALFALVALAVAVPYQQPVMRAVISVPAVLLPPTTFRAQLVIIPSGMTIYPATTAHGVLTITNGSIIGQSIPAGFTIQGVVTDSAIYVPGGSANGYGWAQVPAHATAIGKSGNLPADTINSVIGSSVFVRNLTAFQGGRDSYSVKYATEQDKRLALANARSYLASITNGLHYPCTETTFAKQVVWTCQFVTYELPDYMHISSVRISGKNLFIAVTFTTHLVRVGLK
jgi:hypothetical protein